MLFFFELPLQISPSIVQSDSENSNAPIEKKKMIHTLSSSDSRRLLSFWRSFSFRRSLSLLRCSLLASFDLSFDTESFGSRIFSLMTIISLDLSFFTSLDLPASFGLSAFESTDDRRDFDDSLESCRDFLPSLESRESRLSLLPRRSGIFPGFANSAADVFDEAEEDDFAAALDSASSLEAASFSDETSFLLKSLGLLRALVAAAAAAGRVVTGEARAEVGVVPLTVGGR